MFRTQKPALCNLLGLIFCSAQSFSESFKLLHVSTVCYFVLLNDIPGCDCISWLNHSLWCSCFCVSLPAFAWQGSEVSLSKCSCLVAQCVLAFGRSCHAVLQGGHSSAFLPPTIPHQCNSGPVLHFLGSILYCHDFQILVILTDEQYFVLLLICISLMINDVRYLFVCHLYRHFSVTIACQNWIAS